MKVIIQESFQNNERFSFYIIDKDFKSKKYRYFTNSYLEILDTKVAFIFQNLKLGYEFMQNNTFIYTVYKIRDQFREKDIPIVMKQPLYSLDLNSIKYI